VATPAELITAIDDAILLIVQDGAAEVEVNGQRYRSQDLDKLRLLRKEYEHIADRTAARAGSRGPIIQGFR
jgi:hypothetical protein